MAIFRRRQATGERIPTDRQDERDYRYTSFHDREGKMSDRYFATMGHFLTAMQSKDYGAAAQHVRENLESIPNWIIEMRQNREPFRIKSIPAFEQGGTILALARDTEAIARMAEIISSHEELHPWHKKTSVHLSDLVMAEAIEGAVSANPHCLQTELKGLLQQPDGRQIAKLVSYLEKSGRIVRIKQQRTYRLLPAGHSDVPKKPSRREVKSHRRAKRPLQVIDLDYNKMRYIPLPRAPSLWDEQQTHAKANLTPPPLHRFEVRDANWQVVTIESLPPSERPDPAFRRIHGTGSGLLLVDDLGKADAFENVAAAVLRYDAEGNLGASVGLEHGTYRIGVNLLGPGFIAMSREYVVHAYDGSLNRFLETSMTDSPELLDLRRKHHIPDRHLPNHIRTVALSQDLSKYLVTAVDEAWCITTEGTGLWAARLVPKSSNRRYTITVDVEHTEDEVTNAMRFMELTFPVTADQIKTRYRELARRWHPDLNPNLPQSAEMMKQLNTAAEALTGLDHDSLAEYASLFSSDQRRSGRKSMEVQIEVSLSMGPDADWIYASSFAADGESVYLAGYSGVVIKTDRAGTGRLIYDVGNVPRRIVDRGDFLYLLTDTRLYVLRDQALYRVVDTYEASDIVVDQSGFWLWESKRIRRFGKTGEYLGAIVAQDPIRRVYFRSDLAVVETRRHRAAIYGISLP